MLLLFSKFVSSIIKLLQSNQAPTAIAMGFGLGFFYGLPPFNLLLLIGIGILFSLFNISIGAGFLGAFLGKLLSFFIFPLANALGLWLLSMPKLEPLWTATFSQSLPLALELNYSAVLGFFIIGLLLFAPVVWAFKWFIIYYRYALKKKIESTTWFKTIRFSGIGRWIYTIKKAAS